MFYARTYIHRYVGVQTTLPYRNVPFVLHHSTVRLSTGLNYLLPPVAHFKHALSQYWLTIKHVRTYGVAVSQESWNYMLQYPPCKLWFLYLSLAYTHTHTCINYLHHAVCCCTVVTLSWLEIHSPRQQTHDWLTDNDNVLHVKQLTVQIVAAQLLDR